jgi:hypothetical protein
MSSGATPAEAAHLEACLYSGRLLDIPARLRLPYLDQINDWDSEFDSAEHGHFTTLFNSLEEISTSMNREAVDFASLRKMHGTVTLLSYREFAQWIYLQRRRGSYRYFDQLETLVSRLSAHEVARYRRPAFAPMLALKIGQGRRRSLESVLRTMPGPALLDSNQLEGAILAHGLVDQEDLICAEFAVPSWVHRFRSARRGGFFGFLRKNDPAEALYMVETGDGEGELTSVHAVLDQDLAGAGAPVAVDGVRILADRVIAAVPPELFHPLHLRRRGPEGAFDGSEGILVVAQTSGRTLRGTALRSLLRSLKLHLNDWQLRPFLLLVTDSEHHLRDVQEVLHSEGGLLLMVQPTRSGRTGLWLF